MLLPFFCHVALLRQRRFFFFSVSTIQIISTGKPCFVFYINRLEDTENLLNGDVYTKKKMKDDKFIPIFKERKKHDRFNGMPEEEVSKRTLPDHLALNLDIVIVSTTLFSVKLKIL